MVSFIQRVILIIFCPFNYHTIFVFFSYNHSHNFNRFFAHSLYT